MIKLKNDYAIKSDGNMFTLEKSYKVKNSDKMTKKVLGMYGAIDQALDGYQRHVTLELVRDEDVTLKEIKELITEVKEILRGYR